MTRDAIDAFKSVRGRDEGLTLRVRGERIPMLLSYTAIRRAAKDWQTYSSNAPFRVPIPSEENERSVRQLPIETDPPEHKQYRALVEPFFRRPTHASYIRRIDALIARTLQLCAARSSFDIVRDFALPVQSTALTYLLGVPESEAEIWIAWGTHVFHDGHDSEKKGSELEDYLLTAIRDANEAENRNSFFVALNKMQIEGRLLAESEKLGIANLVFAGGRDTVINAIAYIIRYYANSPEKLTRAASDDRTVNVAVEEFIRAISPLTHIGRVCADASGIENRISLCWAAANYDPAVFDAPETINLARSPNPHVGFGSGHHACLGAQQARAILRSLIRTLGREARSLKIEQEIPNLEDYGPVKRAVGFERLIASFT